MALVLTISLAATASTLAQTDESRVKVTEAIERAIAITPRDVNSDRLRTSIETAARLRERGRKEKIVGYNLVVIGGILGPNLLDFVIEGKYKLANLGMSLTAIGGVIAAIGHRHWNSGNNEIIRMLTRGIASW